MSHFPDEEPEAQVKDSNGKDGSHSTGSRGVANIPTRLFLISEGPPHNRDGIIFAVIRKVSKALL